MPSPERRAASAAERLVWGRPEADEAERLIRLAIAEDLPDGDRSSDPLFPDRAATFADGSRRGGWGVVAHGVLRAAGTVCGVRVVQALFAALDARVRVVRRREDGERVAAGEPVFELHGPAAAVLHGERIALNFLARLSGIASATARWVDELRGLPVVLLDTRKTTPGWRRLEKYAVRAGGGHNHRRDLSDGILVKDNHRDLLRRGGIADPAVWIAALRAAHPDVFLEVEVDDREQFLAVRACRVDAILLDNFALDDLRQAVETNRVLPAPRPVLEASGGIRLDNVRAVAETGVERISAGVLTHSAPSLDVSLETVEIEPLES